MGIVEAILFAISVTLMIGSVLQHILPRLVLGGNDLECRCGHTAKQHSNLHCQQMKDRMGYNRSYKVPCMCFRGKGIILREDFWGRVFNRKKR